MRWWKYKTPKISMPHSSTLSQRLAKKIEKDLGMQCDPSTFTRTYAGSWQKSAGAWLWTMQIKGTPFDVGSCEPASECVKAKNKLSILGNNEICTESVSQKDV